MPPGKTASCAERLDDEAAVVIQLHRRLLVATGAELPALSERLERPAWVPDFVPKLAAA